MTTTATTATLSSVCDSGRCRKPIEITIVVGEQKWQDVDWVHVDSTIRHRAVPELRFCIDATCPGCDYPEIGYSPALEQFICSRCGHAQTDRPAS